jgi:hypothetical protein
MPNLKHWLIISRNQERHHNWGCSLASNYIADEIGEAAISLLFISSENRWI